MNISGRAPLEARTRVAVGCTAVVAGLALLVGCSVAKTSTTGNKPGSAPTGAVARQAGTPSCRPATVVNVNKAGGGYQFDPASISIDIGEFVNFVDHTGVDHTVVSNPDAGLGKPSIDPGETQQIQFNLEGSYTVETGERESQRATMRVAVSSTVGVTCGVIPAVAILSIEPGALSPETLTLKANEGMSIVNDTTSGQQVKCTPDVGVDDDKLQLGPHESQTVVLARSGTFDCTADHVPGAHVKVVVR